MANLFNISEDQLRKQIERAYCGFVSKGKIELYGYLEDEYCNNPQVEFDSMKRDMRHYFFRFLRDSHGTTPQWNYSDGWANISMERLVKKLIEIIKRDYQ